MSLELVPNGVVLPVETSLPIPVERVLNAALEAPLKCVVVVGEDEEGGLYFASSEADGGTVLWWMEKARLALMNISK